MSRYLIIGGTRFFGAEVVRRLMENGDEVTVISRRQPPHSLLGRLSYITAERNTPGVVEVAFADGPFDGVLDYIAMSPEDVTGILRFAGRMGFLLLTSTGSVYTEERDRPLGEDDAELHRPDPQGDTPEATYSRGKRGAERILLQAPGSLLWAVVRPTMVFGPGDPTDRLAWYARALRAGRPVASSTFLFNPVFSSDLATLLVQLLHAPPRRGSVYNAAGLDTLTVDDLVGRLRNLLAPIPETIAGIAV